MRFTKVPSPAIITRRRKNSQYLSSSSHKKKGSRLVWVAHVLLPRRLGQRISGRKRAIKGGAEKSTLTATAAAVIANLVLKCALANPSKKVGARFAKTFPDCFFFGLLRLHIIYYK